MKRAVYAILAVSLLTLLSGCLSANGRKPITCLAGSCTETPEDCASCPGCSCEADNYQDPSGEIVCRACRGRGCRLCRGGMGDGEGFAAGPPSGAITYPYYTTRGPRDFLARNPQSIGP